MLSLLKMEKVDLLYHHAVSVCVCLSFDLSPFKLLDQLTDFF